MNCSADGTAGWAPPAPHATTAPPSGRTLSADAAPFVPGAFAHAAPHASPHPWTPDDFMPGTSASTSGSFSYSATETDIDYYQSSQCWNRVVAVNKRRFNQELLMKFLCTVDSGTDDG